MKEMVSSGVSGGRLSGRRLPWRRTLGGRPQVRWRSLAFLSTTSCSSLLSSTAMSPPDGSFARPYFKEPELYPGLSPKAQGSVCDVLAMGDRGDLFEGGDPVEDLPDAVLEQRHHPREAGLLLDLLDGFLLEHHVAHDGVHFHELEDALPALVAGVLAGVAAGPAVDLAAAQVLGAHVERGERGQVGLGVDFLAVRAEDAHEALSHRRLDRRGDQEGLHAHVDEAGEGARRVVRVERREHEVARER